jgi:putative ABC transport system permease protein
MGHDLHYAFRALRASPGFTAVAVVTLALGIGAATSIYSVVDTILFQPLPFANSDRLVRVVENVPSIFPGRPALQRGPSYLEFLEWRRQTATLTDVAAIAQLGQRVVRTADGTLRLWGAMTSANVFTALGVRAQLGRTLGPEDESRPGVVVLSHDTWQRVFHGSASVLGTTIELRQPDPMFQGSVMLDGRLLTVVGVLPERFEFPGTNANDFYTPMVGNSAVPATRSPTVMMFGRLRHDVGLKVAAEEANLLGAAIRPPRPAGTPALSGPRFDVQLIKEQVVQTLRPALRVLLGAVVAVLLIVCANVANLLLARGTVRQRELAVRVAIGASRARIIRLVLAECVLLIVAGGVVGAMVAAGGVSLIKTFATIDAPGIFRLGFGTSILPRGQELGVDLRMLGAAFAIAALTGLVFGVLPAFHLSQTTHVAAITSRGSSAGRGAARARSALVVGQIVMATMLLVAAGLLVRSFVRLSAVDRGYDPSNVLALQLVFPPDYSIPRKVETIDALLDRFRASPNIEAAGFTRAGLLIGEEITIGTFVPPGRSLEEMRRDGLRPLVRPVSSGYLTAAGIRLLQGREFNRSDTAAAPPSIVISRSVAQRYFASADPIGQTLQWYVANQPPIAIPVIGVVDDVRNTSPERSAPPEVWIEYRQALAMQRRWGDSVARQNELSIGFLSFAIRTRQSPDAAAAAIGRVVREVDANAGVDAIIPMDRLVGHSVARQRFNAIMLALFGVVAGILAAIGIYGVLAYTVVQRRQEIGIRMALGARQIQVLRLVLKQGLAVSALGIAAGIAVAAAASRLLQGLLFGVTPLDVGTFAAVALLFGAVSAVAAYVPAYRATTLDPSAVLRSE